MKNKTEDSRPFCQARGRKMYTAEEIIRLGEYYCRHHFVPVEPEWLEGKAEIEIQRFVA